MFLNTGAYKKICRIIDVHRVWEKSVGGNATFEHLVFCEHTHTNICIHCHRIYGNQGLGTVRSLTDRGISKVKIKKQISSTAGNLLIFIFLWYYVLLNCVLATRYNRTVYATARLDQVGCALSV